MNNSEQSGPKNPEEDNEIRLVGYLSQERGTGTQEYSLADIFGKDNANRIKDELDASIGIEPDETDFRPISPLGES